MEPVQLETIATEVEMGKAEVVEKNKTKIPALSFAPGTHPAEFSFECKPFLPDVVENDNTTSSNVQRRTSVSEEGNVSAENTLDLDMPEFISKWDSNKKPVFKPTAHINKKQQNA